MHTSILALGLTALFQGAAAGGSKSQYSISTTYDTSNFFEAFDFFNEKDPTNGFVEYVDSDTANSDGLAGFVDGAIYMGVDYKTKSPSKGRKSVRVTSHESFTHGLIIADIAHMPGSIPGVWPAYWMFGPSWPTSGEIDILEGVNTQTENKITLHTGPGCSITSDGSDDSSTLVNKNCNAGGASEGCGQTTNNNQNYGDGFNDIGGGVYATEWTSDYIAVWFFPRGRIPDDVQSGNPDPSSWGPATAKFNGGSGCNIDDHFKDHNIIFDTTFCGDWAGSPDVWGKNPETSSLGDCEDYVASNPEAFKNAYWLVNSIKIYNQGGSYGGGNGGNSTGGGNTGSGNSGTGNTGNGNSGNGNTGNGNSGNNNSGNGNSGNNNSGDGNSGNGNTGNGQSGNGDGYSPDGQDQSTGGSNDGSSSDSQDQSSNSDGQQSTGGYDDGQYHGNDAYTAKSTSNNQDQNQGGGGGSGSNGGYVVHVGSNGKLTTWGNGSKRSVIKKRFLA
ncbi:hypothetical protein ACHAPJ_004185 [Fusarium lateritium]